MYAAESNNESCEQMIGNTSKARVVTDTAYLEADKESDAAFQAILALKPHATLFQWKSVSNIPT